MIENILIIEDEKPNSDRLLRLINNIFTNVAIVVLESVSDSLDWFKSNSQPDVILLDVRLSDGLCFEILENVKIKCPIIFTTAFDEYAIKAFKVNGIDYLLKPIDQDELIEAFEKVRLNSQKQQVIPIDNLIQYLKPTEYRSRFLLPYKDGFKMIMVSDISFFYSELKITKAKLKSGMEETFFCTMEELEKQLDPKLFFRANRQFIIHIDSVQYVHNYFNGKLKIVLKKNPELEIIVSRDKAMFLKKWLDF